VGIAARSAVYSTRRARAVGGPSDRRWLRRWSDGLRWQLLLRLFIGVVLRRVDNRVPVDAAIELLGRSRVFIPGMIALAFALSGLGLAIALTGGGVIKVGGGVLSLRSAWNSIAGAWLCLGAAGLIWIGPRVRFSARVPTPRGAAAVCVCSWQSCAFRRYPSRLGPFILCGVQATRPNNMLGVAARRVSMFFL
jgi:hypothetical protein